VMAQARRRVFPGRHEQVAHARRFAGRALARCPVTDEATLCVSELATNALLHTGSGKDGKFEVIVQHGESWARVAVCDEGSPMAPAARALDAVSEDGRGLGMVALIADRWGQWGDEYSRTVLVRAPVGRSTAGSWLAELMRAYVRAQWEWPDPGPVGCEGGDRAGGQQFRQASRQRSEQQYRQLRRGHGLHLTHQHERRARSTGSEEHLDEIVIARDQHPVLIASPRQDHQVVGTR